MEIDLSLQGPTASLWEEDSRERLQRRRKRDSSSKTNGRCRTRTKVQGCGCIVAGEPGSLWDCGRVEDCPQFQIAGKRRRSEAELLERNLTHGLSLPRFCPCDSCRSRTRESTHNISAHVTLYMLAPNVKGKGFDQVFGKSFAPEFLSANRAAWIPALENIDSQRGLAFEHAPIVPQYL